MPAIQRQRDKNMAGAVITSVLQKSVYANGQLVSVNGSEVANHAPTHIKPKTKTGSSNVFVQGIPVNRTGDKDSCGHSRAAGSSNVYVNGG
jgi:uncharacterized Zn-binding protein involved in type VI secretion